MRSRAFTGRASHRAAMALWAFSLCSVGALVDADVTVERVLGPEDPGGKYKHPASFTALASGDLFLVFYGGAAEYADDTAVYASRLARGTKQWSAPVVVADTPHRSEGNGVVWQAPDGRVWLFFITRYGATWSTSRIKAKFSDDDAVTWSDPFLISLEQGLMVRSRPIVLASGEYLLPVYHETGHDTENVGPDSTSLFFRFSPDGARWTESARIRSRIGNIQPAVVELSPGHLVAYCRRGGGYDGRPDGRIVRSESKDGGRTWSRGVDSSFPNPNAAVEFIRLSSGRLLLIYNASLSDRTPLRVAMSSDGDRSYPHRLDVATGPGSFAYPTAVQTSDGRVHLVYTSDERTVLRRAVFTEADIVAAGTRTDRQE